MNGISKQTEGHCLTVDTAIYSLVAIKKAAYRLADRSSIVITPGPETTVSISFSFPGASEKNDPKKVMADFCTELLDQDLREIIKSETVHVRNLILAHAFSKTSLVEGNSN